MEGYLGTEIVDQKDTPYKDYTPMDWAVYFIEMYGGIDGAHHKAWVLDQIARIAKGTPIVIKLAKWKNGESEYRISTGELTKEYFDWVEEMKGEYDEEYEEYEYEYDAGIAP